MTEVDMSYELEKDNVKNEKDKHELDFRNKGSKEWAFCILSDAQEHLSKEFFDPVKANELINKAKRVLDGRYKSDGFFIEVEEPKVRK